MEIFLMNALPIIIACAVCFFFGFRLGRAVGYGDGIRRPTKRPLDGGYAPPNQAWISKLDAPGTKNKSTRRK